MIATAALLLGAILVAHDVADHVLGQTDYHADNKAKPGKEGCRALFGHVALYHGVLMVVLGVVIAVFSLPVNWLGFGIGIVFSAVSHAFIDRRWPVRKLLQLTGSSDFAEMQTPICGMYQADQALHKVCLLISVILMVII